MTWAGSTATADILTAYSQRTQSLDSATAGNRRGGVSCGTMLLRLSCGTTNKDCTNDVRAHREGGAGATEGVTALHTQQLVRLGQADLWREV